MIVENYRQKLILNNSQTHENDNIIVVANDHKSTIKNNLVIKESINKSIRTTKKNIRNIICKINGEYKINCLKLINNINNNVDDVNQSIYIPFSFIHKYFEINGRIVNDSKNNEGNGGEYFEWNHSYSKIFYPDQPYDSKNIFLWFGNYNVEFRDRVKCISAIKMVPISTQWHMKGHYYPTQICQYGLSHFNKNLTEIKNENINLIENGVINEINLLTGDDQLNSESDKNYLTVNKNMKLILKNNNPNYLIAKIHMKIIGNSSISFTIFNINKKYYHHVIYSTINDVMIIDHEKNKVTYGLGIVDRSNKDKWSNFTRDILVDLYKGNLISDRKRHNYYVTKIEFSGNILIKNFIIKTSAHEEFAIYAGDWLIRNQNEQGGWQINVDRKLSKGLLVIKKGWHSAMAQGHAISLLTRLYHSTKNEKYLISAKKALNLFEIESFKNGVKAILFDKFVWYEEYPTVPSIYVLNGFIYSLFGLYDLSKSCDDQLCRKSGQYFDDGIHSLESLLSLYDSGSGSFYDLRHLTLSIAPNLARWDYHSTHINQLLYLNTIIRNDLFKTVTERWIAYMKGHRASHN